MKLLKAAATVGGLTMVSRLAGFVRDILTASILGAGMIADAFFVALKLPNFFRRITAEGAFSISFIPIFGETLEKEGKEQARYFANNMLSFMVAILVPLCVLAMLAMPWVIYVIAPGFADDPVRYDLAVAFSRVTFPYLLFISMTALAGGVLNALERYAPFAAAPVFFNLCLVGGLLLYELMAPAGAAFTAGHAMSWAVSVSGIVQFAWVWYFARKEGYVLRLQWPKVTLRSRRMIKLMIPGMIGAGVLHINLFVDVILASLLPPGSVSYLYYADRLNQLPLGVIGIAIGTALLPMMSRAIAAGRVDDTRNLFNRSFELALFLSLPAALALMVLSYPIISALFMHGAFDKSDAVLTAYVLTAYAAGLPPYIVAKVFSSAFYAYQDTKTPVKVSIISALVNLGGSLLLIQVFGVYGIAMATAIAGWVQLGLLWMIARSMDALRFDDRLKHTLPRVIVSAGAMLAVLLGLMMVLRGWIAGDVHHLRIMALGILVACGGGAYAGVTLLTGAIRFADIRAALRRKTPPAETA